jgi:hypothetical protein
MDPKAVNDGRGGRVAIADAAVMLSDRNLDKLGAADFEGIA